MKLRPDYEKIAYRYSSCGDYAIAKEIVWQCQELADRPPGMLTDAEVLKITQAVYCTSAIQDGSFARAIESAVHAKQKEPDAVPFDYEKWKDGGWQLINKDGCETSSIFLYLFPYTMRRIA